MKNDDVVSLETEQTKSVENLFRLVEQVRHEYDQPAPSDLGPDFFENSADVGFARGGPALQSMKNLNQVIAFGFGWNEILNGRREGHDPRGSLLLQNQVGQRCGEGACIIVLGDAV